MFEIAPDKSAPPKSFSVVLFTAPPPGQTAEAGGPMLRVDGKECVLRAAELFVSRPEVRETIVVFSEDDVDDAKRKVGPHFAFSGIKLVVAKGPHWLDQVSAAAASVEAASTHVLVHDAARPAVPYSDLDAVFEATCVAKLGVVLTAPMRTTLLELDEHRNPHAYHHPQHFVQLLTPLGFTRAAFNQLAATKQEFAPADLTLVKGSPLNIRFGVPGDEKLVKTMLSMLPRQVKPSDGPFSDAKW